MTRTEYRMPMMTQSRAAQPPVDISAIPQEVNLDIYAGDDLFLDIEILEWDGSPLTVVGLVPVASIRQTRESADTLAVFSGVWDGNVARMQLPALWTQDLPTTQPDSLLAWDCQLQRSLPTPGGSGIVTTTVAQGWVAVMRDVTRGGGN